MTGRDTARRPNAPGTAAPQPAEAAMPSTDSRDSATFEDGGPGADDTLDLTLPDDLDDLFADAYRPVPDAPDHPGLGPVWSCRLDEGARSGGLGSKAEEGGDVGHRRPTTTRETESPDRASPVGNSRQALAPCPAGDLLDGLAEWGPVSTPFGVFQLVPVVVGRDLAIIGRWMNDPSVDEFWGLADSPDAVERHLRAQANGDGRGVPCLGVLGGAPMSYWEIYRADLDPVARYHPVRPHDTGLRLLVGRVADRGRGIGSALLRATADHVLDHRPACGRVISEPDLRNTGSIAALLSAGFRFSAEVELPGRRAALMVRDHALRHLL